MTRQNIIDKIKELRRQRNAVILAHNYELGEIQDIADFNGDSLELSIKAAETDADTIVFCGVRFMAETAKILSPEKTVLLPVENAPCYMADMITGEKLRKLKSQHPGAIAVCYVNTTADVKAECEICVTSANAESIIGKLDKNVPIIFVPDANLGQNIINATGREMLLYPGNCPIHDRLRVEEIKRARKEFPDAEVLIHPEAKPELVAAADKSLSTGGMCRYAAASDHDSFIIATEIGILHRLKKENPNKRFIPVSEQAVCPAMKQIRLEDLLECLEKTQYRIEVPEAVRKKAEKPIRRMLELS